MELYQIERVRVHWLADGKTIWLEDLDEVRERNPNGPNFWTGAGNMFWGQSSDEERVMFLLAFALERVVREGFDARQVLSVLANIAEFRTPPRLFPEMSDLYDMTDNDRCWMLLKLLNRIEHENSNAAESNA